VKFRKLFVAVSFSILFVSCVDEINFEVPNDFSDSIVIQGRVVKGEPSFIEVDVSRLFDFSPESRQSLSVDEVIIMDEAGNQMELTTLIPGSYVQILDEASPIQAEVGKSYSIRVRTFDGRTFESSPDMMMPNQAPDRLNLSMVTERVINNAGSEEEEPRLQLSIDTDLDESNDGGLYWDVQSIYRVTDAGFISNDPADLALLVFPVMGTVCYLTEKANTEDIFALGIEDLSTRQFRDVELSKLPITAQLVEGYYFEVRQYSLSSDAIQYWNAIDILSEREGSVFDRPVGQVPTNLTGSNPSDNIFGYFFATEEQIIRTRVDESFSEGLQRTCYIVGGGSETINLCFNAPNGTCTCAPCCDCLASENSTTERPSFWED